MHVYANASGVGYGAYFDFDKKLKIQSHWTLEQSKKSSTFRELLAIFHALKVFSQQLNHVKVKVFSDSQSACRIVQVGSRLPELQKIAVDIFQLCLIHDISIEPPWIIRSVNHFTDALSKTVDLDDWQLNPQVFLMLLNKEWGPFTIDRFASSSNTQLIRFNSRFWCTEAEAVDTFTQDWSTDNYWLCPLVSLIISTL